MYRDPYNIPAPLPHATRKDFERWLHQNGYSVSASKLIAARGYVAARDRVDSDDSLLTRCGNFFRTALS